MNWQRIPKMYKLTKPTVKIEDFFDKLLTNRQSTAGKFRLGRIKSIKQELIEKETEYNDFIANGQTNELYQIVPTQRIEIPRDTPVLKFFNFPGTITKMRLLERLREYKLINFIDSNQTKASIYQQLEQVNLGHIENAFTSNEDLYSYIRYADHKVMTGAYEDYLVKDSDGIGRNIYDELLLLADSGTCPYCLVGNVTTLDHYLPKAEYISYSITPINLIPSCVDCNTNKSDEIYDTGEKLLINAYFEDITNVNWLDAEVVEKFPITFNFSVNNNIQSDVLKSRLKRQFEKLQLESRYGKVASRCFRIRVKSIVMEYNSGGLEAVKKKLESDKSSAEFYNLNSVEAKVYESLLNSNWFMQEDTLDSITAYYELN